jgi:hypothetical protein
VHILVNQSIVDMHVEMSLRRLQDVESTALGLGSFNANPPTCIHLRQKTSSAMLS